MLPIQVRSFLQVLLDLQRMIAVGLVIFLCLLGALPVGRKGIYCQLGMAE